MLRREAAELMRRPDTVDDIMTRNVLTIDEGSTIRQADELMKDRRLRKIVVTRGGKPAYILEDWKIWGKNKDQKIAEIAQELEPAYTVRSGTLLDEVRPQLEEKPAIVVMDKEGKAIVGVLSATDIADLAERRIQQRPWEQTYRGSAQRRT